MSNYRVYVVPDTIVNGQMKTLVLQSQFGLALAGGLDPKVTEVFQVDSGEAFRDEEFFHETVSRQVTGLNRLGVIITLNEFQRGYRGLEVTRLIPLDRRLSDSYDAFCKSHESRPFSW